MLWRAIGHPGTLKLGALPCQTSKFEFLACIVFGVNEAEAELQHFKSSIYSTTESRCFELYRT
jgi:hypothetical protein